MPYVSEPGWFEQAISSGIDRFQSARANRDRQRQIAIENKRAEEELGLQKSADARAATAAGIANYLPNLKNTMVRNPDAAIPTSAFDQVAGLGNQMGGFGPGIAGSKTPTVPGTPWNDTQREATGLPTSLDLQKRKLEGIQTSAAIATAPQDAQAARIKQLEPILKSASDRFVAGPILKAGGRLNPSALPQLAQAGYTAFIKDMQTKGYGSLTPAESDQARAYFDQAVKDAYGEQQDRDIKRLAATDHLRAGSDHAPQMLQALNNLAGRANKSAEDMLKNSYTLKSYLTMAPADWTPAARTEVHKFMAAQQAEKQLMAAAAAFGSGSMGPEDAQKILAAASKQFLGEGSPPSGNSVGIPQGGAPAKKVPLTPADKAKAKSDPGFAAFLKSTKGYSEADWQ